MIFISDHHDAPHLHSNLKWQAWDRKSAPFATHCGIPRDKHYRSCSWCDKDNEGFRLRLRSHLYNPHGRRQIRGAPAIASLASLSVAFHLSEALEASPPLDFLASSETLKPHVEGILEFLVTARPTAVNLSAATTRLTRILHSFTEGTDTRIIAMKLIAEGNLIADEDVGRNKEMSKHGAEWLSQHYQNSGSGDSGFNVLTVCNTGSLATSVSYRVT